MKPAPFDYQAPDTLREAIDQLVSASAHPADALRRHGQSLQRGCLHSIFATTAISLERAGAAINIDRSVIELTPLPATSRYNAMLQLREATMSDTNSELRTPDH